MNYLTTIKFIKTLLDGKEHPVEIRSIKLAISPTMELDADVYEPKQSKNYRGTILVLHGMNCLGNKDPRLMTFCRAAALHHFRVVMPTYEIVTKHHVDVCSITEFGDTICALAKNKELTPKGKIGIFTASFSGSLSIRAANHPNVAPYVSSWASLGICYHPKSTFRNILAERTDDYYAKCISIKNLLRIKNELSPYLEKGLDAMIADAFDCKKRTHLDACIATLSPEEGQHLEKIYASLGEDVSPLYEAHIQRMHEVFMTESNLKELKCFVTLIHSKGDTVLHTIESEMLYKQLQKDKVKSRLLITSLLDHADLNLSIRYLPEVIKAIHAMHGFLKHV